MTNPKKNFSWGRTVQEINMKNSFLKVVYRCLSFIHFFGQNITDLGHEEEERVNCPF